MQPHRSSGPTPGRRRDGQRSRRSRTRRLPGFRAGSGKIQPRRPGRVDATGPDARPARSGSAPPGKASAPRPGRPVLPSGGLPFPCFPRRARGSPPTGARRGSGQRKASEVAAGVAGIPPRPSPSATGSGPGARGKRTEQRGTEQRGHRTTGLRTAVRRTPGRPVAGTLPPTSVRSPPSAATSTTGTSGVGNGGDGLFPFGRHGAAGPLGDRGPGTPPAMVRPDAPLPAIGRRRSSPSSFPGRGIPGRRETGTAASPNRSTTRRR